jgi:PAS domain S-box-containing protein
MPPPARAAQDTPMKIKSRVLVAIKPFLAPGATACLAAVLIATITFTTFDPRWVVFLSGVLAAAVLATVSRTANARWIIARRTAQLLAARAKFAKEARLRARAEESLARLRTSVELIDEKMPAMLCFVDTEGRVRYHNHAYTRWSGVEGKSIDGRLVADLVGRVVYGQIEEHLREAMQGLDVRYERVQIMRNGDTCRLNVQYLPSYGADGKVAGVFAILTDITRPEDVGDADEQEAVDASHAAGTRLVAALERDEFTLYWQGIDPLGHAPRGPAMREVLLRMNEEEAYHLPPGTFLPVAEELGLLPDIDRWVVRHVVDFAAGIDTPTDSTYMINLSTPTIVDPGFGEFVRDCLATHAIPGKILCFELPETDVLADPAAYREFVGSLDGSGCRFAVSGFGRNPLSLRLLKQLRVDYLKLDGSIVLDVLRSPAQLARVKSINRAAHAAGMSVVAECVEDESTRAALERVETDFAQGFGIALPLPMSALDVPHPAREAPREFLDQLVAA